MGNIGHIREISHPKTGHLHLLLPVMEVGNNNPFKENCPKGGRKGRKGEIVSDMHLFLEDTVGIFRQKAGNFFLSLVVDDPKVLNTTNVGVVSMGEPKSVEGVQLMTETLLAKVGTRIDQDLFVAYSKKATCPKTHLPWIFSPTDCASATHNGRP